MSEGRPHILIAEDNRAMAGLSEYTLQRAGFEVTVCYHGSKAVSVVEEKQFDFILTDFQMPGASGKDVIQAARKNKPNATTPIVLCSAKGYELDTAELTDEYSLSGVVTKPFSPLEIVELVRTHTQCPADTV